jgi:hypothetical protein
MIRSWSDRSKTNKQTVLHSVRHKSGLADQSIIQSAQTNRPLSDRHSTHARRRRGRRQQRDISSRAALKRRALPPA